MMEDRLPRYKKVIDENSDVGEKWVLAEGFGLPDKTPFDYFEEHQTLRAYFDQFASWLEDATTIDELLRFLEIHMEDKDGYFKATLDQMKKNRDELMKLSKTSPDQGSLF